MNQTSDILLTTINARYRHTAFGLRCLLANLAELRPHAMLLEFECKDNPEEMVETILNHAPRIVALGVYIWNADASIRLVRLLKRIQPEIIVVLGGPEVSFETAEQAIVQEADYVVCGEGEILFQTLCRTLLSGQQPEQKILKQSDIPFLPQLTYPYDAYSSQDISNRIIYVERSRGCPYLCSFCLSSLDQKVRDFPLDSFLQQMQRLLQRGVRQFKFVDRTFNLNTEDSTKILEFFLSYIRRSQAKLFLHFEMVPDRLPATLKNIIQQFPPGTLQFEIGIQSFNPEIQKRIQRRQDTTRSIANLYWLLQHTEAHLHTDLIVGLPGESLASFAAGFNRLATINPHEIQIGILKRLRGAPINAYSQTFGMVYNPDPPYDLLYNNLLDFSTLRRLKRFARFWDLFGNSGRFNHVRTLIFQQQDPFYTFLTLSDWLFSTIGRTHEIALRKQFDWLFHGLIEGLRWDRTMVLTALEQDFCQGALREPPDCLRDIKGGRKATKNRTKAPSELPARQARHQQMGKKAAFTPSIPE